MKQRYYWLLALVSILTLMTTTTIAIAAEGTVSGHVEIGVSGMDTTDNPARVNEYVSTRSKNGLSFAPKVSLESVNEGSALGFEADIMGPRDQHYNLEFDAKRIFRFDLDYQVMEHWKDHDTLEHLGATMRNDTGGNQPRVTTDATVGQLAGPTGIPEAAAYERYEQEMNRDYTVTRRESDVATSIALPALPNIVFHAGLRIETREGQEQATTASKCNQCHVQANVKEIDETTKDFTLGATGKFGKFTFETDYLHRTFDEDADSPTYKYAGSGSSHGGIPDADQLLYTGSQSYKETPDSQKDSIHVKTRYDYNLHTSLSAAYVYARVESDKDGDPDSYSISKDTLKSKFNSYFLKGATNIAGIRLTMHGGGYNIDGPDYELDFPDRDDAANHNHTFDNPADYDSAESRDVYEFGMDAVYRIYTGTTLRLGYEYEEIDRDVNHLQDTTTNSFKVALKSRFNKELSGRISYLYQDIDDPLRGAHTGILQDDQFDDPNHSGLAWDLTANYAGDPGNTTAVFYWNSVYPNRTLDTSVDPEDVHEVKMSSTWAPKANMALTVSNRYRKEENDNVHYKQDTYAPGVSIYYAPNNKLDLTMAYNFNHQKTENRMCVGWYHG